MGKNTLKVGIAAVAALTGAAGSAAAQPAGANNGGSGGTGDIVITARKRSENLQKVPVAVTAATGKQLEQQGVRETSDLGRIVPSLTVSTTASQNSAAIFSLRGQAPGDVLLTVSQPVGVYVDTVNVPHPVGLQGSFFDIQRVEVLKGPQGTLYGRNTTGGAVNIITRGADYNGIHGFVGGEVGNYSDWKASAAVNVPIVDDVLAVRLAYQHWNRDGFGHSSTTGEDFGADHDDDIARLSVRFDPTASLTSTTKLEYVRLDQNGTMETLRALVPGIDNPNQEAIAEQTAMGVAPVGIAPYVTNDFFTNTAQADQYDRLKAWHFSEDLTWNISDGLKLRSITGYHKVTDFQALDVDASPFDILEVNTQIPPALGYPQPNRTVVPNSTYDSYTQEFDLSGSSFGRLDWLVGAFGSYEHGSGSEPAYTNPALPPPSPLPPAPGLVADLSDSQRETTSTWAFYTQNDLHLSDRVSVTLGARYTAEREKNTARQWLYLGSFAQASAPPFLCLAGPLAPVTSIDQCNTVSSATKSSGTSYLASFNYQITPQTLLYVKTARGFRGGALQFRAPTAQPVKPEIATDYEIGLKSEFFDHRLRVNLAAYHTNYDNKQETVIVATPTGGNATVLFNAATAVINGFEGEFAATPIRDWSIYGTVSYLNGKYLDYGNPLNGDGLPVFAGSPCNPPAPAPVPDPLPAQCIAHDIPFSNPQWQYSIGSRYEHDLGPGRLGGQLDWSWHGKTVSNVLNSSTLFPQSLQDEFRRSRGLLNGRIDYTLPDQQTTVALFATNLLDTHYQTGALAAQLGVGLGITGEPRMWGVSVRKAFGEE